MPRFTLAAPLMGSFLVLSLGACAPEVSAPLPSHPAPVGASQPSTTPEPSSLKIEREATGPYLEGSVERFRLVLAAPGVDSILWSASGGRLESQEERATWTLPRAGPATLSVTVVTKSGQQFSETYSFQVARAADAQGDEAVEPVSFGAPVAVDTTSDSTGYVCDLAFDATGTGHMIYRNSTHPSLWYGTWNGTTWTTQLVDGMGFNTGGMVTSQMAFVLDASGTPHIAYKLTGRGLWYATRSGNTWIRERVDPPSNPVSDYSSWNSVAIALDPSQGNRPTIAYQWRGLLPSENNSTRYRIAIAYRTGASSWTSEVVKFGSAVGVDETLMGDVLFQSSGTLFLPHSSSYLGSWKAGPTLQNFEFIGEGANLSTTAQISMVWAGTNRLLMRTPHDVYDVAIASPLAASTYKYSYIDTEVMSLGDIVFTGGKPTVVHLHDSNLELVTPDSRGLWTYTQLGSAASSWRMGLAVRPTTGQLHLCYQHNNKVMFQ